MNLVLFFYYCVLERTEEQGKRGAGGGGRLAEAVPHVGGEGGEDRVDFVARELVHVGEGRCGWRNRKSDVIKEGTCS